MPHASTLRSASPNAQTDEELVLRCWSGDEQALSTLLGRYRNFVRMKAQSCFVVGADREDVIQEGMIGLYKAIRDYKSDRGASFGGFAELCITRQIITAIKTARRHKHAPLNSYVSLYLPAHSDDESDHELVEQFVSDTADPVDSVISSQELAVLEEYCGQILSDLEAEVLQRYIEGQSYQEIADELDRHVKSIDNALQRIKRKLDVYLESRRLSEAV